MILSTQLLHSIYEYQTSDPQPPYLVQKTALNEALIMHVMCVHIVCVNTHTINETRLRNLPMCS